MSDPQVATTKSGHQVHRQQGIFIPTMGKKVPCAPYDDHFVFYTNEPNQSAFQCTCGSPAVVVNVEGGAPMLVCLMHATYGQHVTGSRTWI